MTPDLEADRNPNDREQVEVGKMVHAPDGKSRAPEGEGLEQFCKDEDAESVGARCFQRSVVELVGIDRKRHGGGGKSGEHDLAKETAIGDAPLSRARWLFHHVAIDRIGGEAERGEAVRDEIDPEQMDRE